MSDAGDQHVSVLCLADCLGDLITQVFDLVAHSPDAVRAQMGKAFAQFGRIDAKTFPTWARMMNRDRKSTRLNSSHVAISYAVCGLKKKDSGQYSKILIRAKQLNVKISNYEYAIHQASRDDATNMISAEECSRNSIRHIHIT